jgi:hypothetical protein
MLMKIKSMMEDDSDKCDNISNGAAYGDEQ